MIEQLEKTGNRPHLIRELATVLSNISDAVSRYVVLNRGSFKGASLTLLSSANPGALLSSRLAAYLKRPGWTALSPCPLDKELTSVHPRKIYYYLTTIPKQDLPADSSNILDTSHPGGKGGKRIISPSISNASVDEDAEAAEERKRDALSPSPEVDLSAPEIDAIAPVPNFDIVPSPRPAGSTFSNRSSLTRDGSGGSTSESVLAHNHRAASPPLEGDEKEFTQTASSMRMRGMSLDDSPTRPSTEDILDLHVAEDEEEKAKQNREAAEALFGGHHPQQIGLPFTSSPMINPMQSATADRPVKLESDDVAMQDTMSILGNEGTGLTWDTREPEDIQIEDLDELFGAF